MPSGATQTRSKGHSLMSTSWVFDSANTASRTRSGTKKTQRFVILSGGNGRFRGGKVYAGKGAAGRPRTSGGPKCSRHPE
jgi:hypothetical protein